MMKQLTESYFLSSVRWQPKSDETQYREPYTWENDIEQVVEDSASNVNIEDNVRVRLFRTTRIVLNVSLDNHVFQVPFARLYVIN